MNLKSVLIVLISSILFAGCSPKRKIYPVEGFSVSGRVTYDKKTPVVRAGRLGSDSEFAPIPCAFVEVIDTSDNDKVVTQGTTDDDGVFKIGLPEDLQTAPLAVKVYTVCGLRKFPMAVTKHSTTGVDAPTYYIQSEVFIGKKNDMVIHVKNGLFSGSLAGAFNIYSQIVRGYKFVAEFGGENNTEFPPLSVNWESGEDGAGCTCFFNRFLFKATINLREDENDDSVILHEFGHYLHDVFSRSTSPGGPHTISCSQDDDPQLTFSEGWATGFSLIVRKSPHYIDTGNQNFFVEHEFPCHTGQGSTSETIVAAMYLDLYDGPKNGMPTQDGDTINITFKQIWDAMKNISGPRVTAHSFYISLINSGAVTQQEWDNNFTSLALDPPTLVMNSSAMVGNIAVESAPLVPPSADPEFHALMDIP